LALETAVVNNHPFIVDLFIQHGIKPTDSIIKLCPNSKMLNLLHQQIDKNIVKGLEEQQTVQKSMLNAIMDLVKKESFAAIRDMAIVPFLDLADLNIIDFVIGCANIEVLDIFIEAGMPYDWDDVDAPIVQAVHANLLFYKHLELKIKCLRKYHAEPLYKAIESRNIDIVAHFAKTRPTLSIDIITKAFDLVIGAETQSDFIATSILQGRNLSQSTKEQFLKKILDLGLDMPQTTALLL
jgi:hypothetical protein